MSDFRPRGNTKEFEFDAQALYNLLVHYTDGLLPLNGEVQALLANENLNRKIGLLVASQEWDDASALHIGYDGKRTRSWSKGAGGEPVWEELNDTPRRQG